MHCVHESSRSKHVADCQIQKTPKDDPTISKILNFYEMKMHISIILGGQKREKVPACQFVFSPTFKNPIAYMI